MAILGQRGDVAVGQAGGIVGDVLIQRVAITIVAVQTTLGGDPQITGAILKQGGDAMRGQATFAVDIVEVIAPFAGVRRDSEEQQ